MAQTILGKITHFQESHPVAVVAIFGFLTLAMLPGMGKIDTVVALENMMPASSEPVQEFNQLRAEGSGRDTIAYSYVGDDGKEMSRIFSEIKKEASYQKPEGLKTGISGVPAVQQRLASMVQRDKNVTTMFSLLLVFLITWLLFRGSLTAALMPLLIVALSVVWLYGTMGYLGIPLSTLAGSVAALVIGIGIAYAIHIGNIYRFNRRDNTIKESLVDSMDDIGVSIIASAITTISAFMAFLVGKMPEMHRFGIIMSLGIGYAAIFTLLLLPAVFVLEESMMSKISESLGWRKDFP